MKDDVILNLLFSRSEDAISQIQLAYGSQCMSLAKRILNSPEDAEECVNDAYMRVWNSIPPNRPLYLSAYVLRITRNLAISRLRANTSRKRDSEYDLAYEEMESCLGSANTPEQKLEEQLMTSSVEAFLDSLKTEDRVLFVRRYWFSDSYSLLATRLGISEKNVSVRLVRLRKELKHYLQKQGVLE